MSKSLRTLLVLILLLNKVIAGENFRPFRNDEDAKFWLEDMLGYHRFTIDEVREATGLSTNEVAMLASRLNIQTNVAFANDRLTVVPYPGGRHPRIGFLEGAINPQRETKVSIFLPWDHSIYVVADVPEAIWSNLGLTYLAHTHVPTLWTKENIKLPQLEWKRLADGTLSMERVLPNGIQFGTEVRAGKDGVRMREWLRNGTEKRLSALRVQNCVMLKGAKEFAEQTDANKVFEAPYAAAKSRDGRHWVITGWAPIHRAWGNAPVPCLHADPIFPECDPGQRVEVHGWISFYEGDDVRTEFRRLDSLNWR